MNQEIIVLEKQVLVSLSGSIYVEEAKQVRDSLNTYIDQGYTEFVINLENLNYIDSSGLGALVAILKRAQNKGGGVRIENLRGLPKDLFELTRLNKVFEM